MKLNFRNRIALFTALAAAVTIGAVFLIVFGVVYFTAYDHLDDDLRQEKEEVLSSLRWTGDSISIEDMPEWEEKEHLQVEVNPTFLQVVDAGGRTALFRSCQFATTIYYSFDPDLSERCIFQQPDRRPAHPARVSFRYSERTQRPPSGT
jgi:two-component system heavy metal sensor histidine kinase CusS